MSQDKENVSRTSASNAAITQEAASEDKFETLANTMISAIREIPKLCSDSMKGVVGRMENTVNNMEKLLSKQRKVSMTDQLY